MSVRFMTGCCLKAVLLASFLLFPRVATPSARILAQSSLDVLKEARQYTKFFGTHQIAPRYAFEPTKHPVKEGADRLLDAGFTSFKFDMQVPPGATRTLLQNMQDPSQPNLAFLDMPFKTFMFWLRGGNGVYHEVFELTAFLIQRYRGTNKTFMLGTWKGDYQIRDWTGVGTPLNRHPNASSPILWERVAIKKAAWEAQQAGVDAARRELAHLMQGVQVYSYLEVNLVHNATVNYTVIEDMVPSMNPVPDYISVSLSTLPQYIMSPDPAAVSRSLQPLLNRIAAQLPSKLGIPTPRVFIGEFEFPLRNKYGRTNGDTWTTPTQERQAKHALATVAAAVAWGVPHVMWWELYDNTKVFTKEGRDKSELGMYEDQGFGLISHENVESVLYKAIKLYMKQATEWLSTQMLARGGALPCNDDFRQWVVNSLVSISNSINAGDGAGRYTAPTVIKRGCA